MIDAVFDTNVIVSGMLSPAGPPGRIVDWLIAGDIRAVFDDRILAEYERVLHYPRLKLPGTEVDILLARLLRSGICINVSPQYSAIELPHTGDLPFAQCSLTAQVPLVTGNTRHFPPDILNPVPVLSPFEYMRLLELNAKRSN
jgi:putative PIN family toxin of toxin-antitoxin system